jgi:hypothetical protein
MVGSNRQLNIELHLVEFPIYESPDWDRDYAPRESAIRRFHQLERAAAKAQKRKA